MQEFLNLKIIKASRKIYYLLKDNHLVYNTCQEGCTSLANAYNHKKLANKMLDIIKRVIDKLILLFIEKFINSFNEQTTVPFLLTTIAAEQLAIEADLQTFFVIT